MNPITNPYAPGAGSKPPALTGRDKEIESFNILVQRLRAGRTEKNLMITGLRGVGKTVLLTTYRDVAESIGFVTGSAEITHGTDFKALMARLLRRVIVSLNFAERVKDRAWQAAAVLKAFTLKLPDGHELGLNVEAIKGRGDSGEIRDDLSDLFVAVGDAAKERKKGIVLLLDEVQFLAKKDLEALIAATHQIAQKSLPLAVVGAGLPQIPKLAGEAKSYSERLFNFPKIDRLDQPSAKEALERPARDLKVQFEPTATAGIIEFTEGYPYFLQEYGKHVWNLAKGPTITMQDVKAAKEQVIAQLDENFFRVRLDRTTPAEKNYIVAMAHLGRGPYKTGDVSTKLKRSTTTLAPLRGQLINKGLVYSPSHGLTDFTVPQFDDFLRRNFLFTVKKSRSDKI